MEEVHSDEAWEWVLENTPKETEKQRKKRQHDHYVHCCVNGLMLPEYED